jgi:hypothetical protein
MDDLIFKTIEENYQIKHRGIPKGCRLCLKGQKGVLFLNGLCQNPSHCSWYCPLSKKRKGKRTTYINEIEVSSMETIFNELDKMEAKGLSITGGEPLFSENLEKTLHYIAKIKEKRDPEFHIHLYTNGIRFNKEIAFKLSKAGLDEIRFHPPQAKWGNIKAALNKGMVVGAEVPVIPGKEHQIYLKKFIFYLNRIGASFINLNEFEYCFPNSKILREKGFSLKSGTIASVKKSKTTATHIMQEIAPKTSLKIHFCSIKAKDYFQLKERYLRRAKNIRTSYEEITDEGLLLYGQIEGLTHNLHLLMNYLLKNSGMPKKLCFMGKSSIKVPYYVLIDESFQELLEDFNLEGYIIEALPFNGATENQHRHITEKTPIEIFKEEFNDS